MMDNAKHRASIKISTGKDWEDWERKRLWLRRSPLFLDPLRRLLASPASIVEPYVKPGQIVVDLGCGFGFYTFPLAKAVGPNGKVYAIDLSQGCIRYIQKKAQKRRYGNIEAIASSAAELGGIASGSVDFVFANGLLCSMARGRRLAMSEIKRILRPKGRAFLSLGMPPPFGFVDEAEWIGILSDFHIEEGGNFQQMFAVVSKKASG